MRTCPASAGRARTLISEEEDLERDMENLAQGVLEKYEEVTRNVWAQHLIAASEIIGAILEK